MKINTKPCTTPSKCSSDNSSSSNYYDGNEERQQSNGMSCVYNSESPTGKTILITNYASNPANVNNATPQQKSSITIYTHKTDAEHANMPASSINILINNHYENSLADSTGKRSIKLEHDEHTPKSSVENNETRLNEKMSTTTNAYHVGDDVLVEQSNGQFHCGTIQTTRNDSFAIQYDNNVVGWATPNQLKRVNTTKTASRCIVCKNADSGESIRICCHCQRGFHDKCLPKAKCSESAEPESDWCCFKCVAIADERVTAMNEKRRTITPRKRPRNDKFSYDIDSLTWDVHHRQNKEHIYCYCGKKGKWFMQMLQCVRCQQWFHANCVKCLNAPLYFGDRFYLFACAHCNHGTEFLRRLHMNMEDIVHLLLFNLTLHFSKRFYNLTNVIFPYARDNWPALQLPPKLKNMQANDVKDEILRALKMHTARFRAGNEVKKKVANWALASRSPPKAPIIVLPQGPQLTEKFINDLFCEQARINYMPQHLSTCDISVSDAKMKDIMFGKNVASYINSAEVDADECTSSDDSENVFTSSESDEDILADVIVEEHFRNLIDTNHLNQTPNDADKKEGGQPHQPTEIKRKRGRPRLSIPEKSNESSMDISYYSSDDTSSRGTLDSIIPPPENFSGMNNPFLFDSKSVNSNKIRPRNSIKGTENLVPSVSATGKNQLQMVRTVKRRLSANDLIIGPNMKVKRRKTKKRLDDVEVISTTSIADLPNSATYLPISSDSRRISLSALRSTIRDQPNHATNQKAKKAGESDSYGSTDGEPSTGTSSNSSVFGSTSIIESISSSPIKDSLKEESMTELTSSVNMYFGGGSNRIDSGKHFTIKGKRVLADGRLQYLIDWDGVS